MARVKEDARKYLQDRNANSSSSSRSPKRSSTPPSAPIPKKNSGEIEDHTISDQGQKRKREEFEEDNNLDLLAEVVTTQ
ncbi:hypothetical protein A2U01_0034131, partial [Trifolium medium]|nr:hypothetical protein [Trifolium medium]